MAAVRARGAGREVRRVREVRGAGVRARAREARRARAPAVAAARGRLAASSGEPLLTKSQVKVGSQGSLPPLEMKNY